MFLNDFLSNIQLTKPENKQSIVHIPKRRMLCSYF